MDSHRDGWLQMRWLPRGYRRPGDEHCTGGDRGARVCGVL